MNDEASGAADGKLAACRQYLMNIGAAEIPHSGHNLMAHLEGTFRLLQRWKVPEPVCFAGLFHSVYGTDGFKRNPITLDDRAQVAALIGGEAERLVYLFSSIRRRTMFEPTAPSGIQFREESLRTDITQRELVGLLHVEYANTLDQCPDMGLLGKFVMKMLGKKWLNLRHLLSPACNAELVKAFAASEMPEWKFSAIKPLFWVLKRL